MDPQRFAQHVVQSSLRIGQDEHVLISTWQHTIPLAEALALECLRADALPLIQLTTDHLYRAVISEIGEYTLRKAPQHVLAAYNELSAIIHIHGPENPRIFELGAVGRSAALQEGAQSLLARAIERRIRRAELHVGYITPERARKYGVDYHDWLAAHDAALTVDPAHLAEEGRHLAERLSGAHTVHITHPGGTNLRLECTGRTAFLDDGVIDEEDVAAGNVWTRLPGGTVAIAPRETSVGGRAVFPAVPLWGKTIQDLDWDFKDGELIDFHAYEHGIIVTDFLADARESGSRRLGWIGIGLNPKARSLAPGLDEASVRGAVTIGLGDNRVLGGENMTGFSWACTLMGATVDVDGQRLVEAGKLMHAEAVM
jgi:leucyl aminopeptidase (aminopeptidase T)